MLEGKIGQIHILKKLLLSKKLSFAATVVHEGLVTEVYKCPELGYDFSRKISTWPYAVCDACMQLHLFRPS